jgi:hypothetical protein
VPRSHAPRTMLTMATMTMKGGVGIASSCSSCESRWGAVPRNLTKSNGTEFGSFEEVEAVIGTHGLVSTAATASTVARTPEAPTSVAARS